METCEHCKYFSKDNSYTNIFQVRYYCNLDKRWFIEKGSVARTCDKFEVKNENSKGKR